MGKEAGKYAAEYIPDACSTWCIVFFSLPSLSLNRCLALAHLLSLLVQILPLLCLQRCLRTSLEHIWLDTGTGCTGTKFKRAMLWGSAHLCLLACFTK
mmetsp:Transcript_31791/g.38426  ORF Transcript_31791/g.38426 Transcript_31791/m.38426 type:complete len:98 (+) Transcript_31791:2868-3161(+)